MPLFSSTKSILKISLIIIMAITLSGLATIYSQPNQSQTVLAATSLGGTCSGAVNGNTITWSASAFGGSGPGTYTYSWTGDVIGSGSSIIKTYVLGPNNTKTANITIRSGTQTFQTSCSATISGTNPPGTNICNAFIYSGWTPTPCTAGSIQKQTVISASPANCTGGNPILSRNCVTTATFDGSCTGTPGTTKGQIIWTAFPIPTTGSYSYAWSGHVSGVGKSISKTYTDTEKKYATVTIVGGANNIIERRCEATPILSTCTNFNYSAWSTCLNNNQTRTITSKSPVNCLGGNQEILSRSCTSQPSTCTSFIYSPTWGPCSATSSTQTRTIVSSSPAGCLGGNPVLSQSCIPTTYTLNGSCIANTSATTTNQTVIWTATVSGAPGPYTYSWIGDELPAVSGNPISKTYSTAGIKQTNVLISYAGQSITRSCSVRIVLPLDGSCSADPLNVNLGQSIAWTAFPTGGTGPYSYLWSGDDGLSGTGSFTSIIYPTISTPLKRAMVIIKSGLETIIKGCTASVSSTDPGTGTETLSGSCSANPNLANVGDSITWTANVSGGPTNQYTYIWKLDGEPFDTGKNNSITKPYNTVGEKKAEVYITSGTEYLIKSCIAEIGRPFTPIAVSCSDSQSEVDAGQPMVWGVTATGGNGVYEYTWSGSDSLQDYKPPSTDNLSTTTKTYYTTGKKLGRVTVTSKGQSVSKDCFVTVNTDTSTVRITNFTFTNAEVTNSVINQDTGVIVIDVPSNTNTANLVPAITISPDIYTTLINVQAEKGNDFTQQRVYKVKYTTDNYSVPKTYYVFVNKAFRLDGNDIISCSLPNITNSVCTISQNRRTVHLTVPMGTDKTRLAPTFVLSPKATISAASGSTQNFSRPRAYLVTSEIGNTKKYLVEINTPPKITTFKVKNLSTRDSYTGKIDENSQTITLTLPANTDKTKLITTIRTSTEGADWVQIEPNSSSFYEFYTVSSQYYSDSGFGGTRTSQRGDERYYRIVINYLPATS